MGPTIFHKLFARSFRPSRMAFFLREMDITSKTRVLDVGGEAGTWQGLPFCPKVTLVNYADNVEKSPCFNFIKADARDIPLENNSFDVCFSNSMIEHLWTWEDQEKAANEMRRLAPRYFVQTPNFWFPVEPHFLAPFFHWLPLAMRKRLAFVTPWQLMDRSPKDDLIRLVHELHLLTAAEMQKLFPEAQIVREKFAGITKSLIAVH